MTRLVLAEFADPETLVAAARRARQAGLRGLDAHTPFAMEELPEALGFGSTGIRLVMLASGIAGAAFAFWLQWWTAVLDYPVNAGGRPLFSWQVFVMPTFEGGILLATFGGILAFLLTSGLPRLNHPVFDAHGFDRASQDRFFLAIEDPRADGARVAALLDGLAPLSIREVAA
ncbi:DUF3341 domain-containing protein [Falsiroseomonas sp. HW251]|uniref:DUF3341 domain-containing protein n=1 Tax=Falsiroseomonas sp. HW251 TaxID=3390998 RepID=UPI003D322745